MDCIEGRSRDGESIMTVAEVWTSIKSASDRFEAGRNIALLALKEAQEDAGKLDAQEGAYELQIAIQAVIKRINDA